MNILHILREIVAALTGAFLALSGLGTPPPADQVAQIASTTDAVVQEAVQEAEVVTKKDVAAAYELGQSVGRLRALAEATTTAQAPVPPIVNPLSTPNNTVVNPMNTDTSAPSSSSAGNAPAPAVTESSPPTAPASQARIEIGPARTAKGLDAAYAALPEYCKLEDNSNPIVHNAIDCGWTANPYPENGEIDLVAFLYDADGSVNKTAPMQITATDPRQNRTKNGTGSLVGAYFGGKLFKEFGYTFSYFFFTPGEHTITFSANGMSESVTLVAVE